MVRALGPPRDQSRQAASRIRFSSSGSACLGNGQPPYRGITCKGPDCFDYVQLTSYNLFTLATALIRRRVLPEPSGCYSPPQTSLASAGARPPPTPHWYIAVFHGESRRRAGAPPV